MTSTTTQGPVAMRASVMGYVLMASLAPLILLAFNTDWFFTREGYLDPWHYVGFFLDYGNRAYSPGAYKLARLPWILAGYAVNRVLPTVDAAYALHAAFLVVMCGAMFWGLYNLFGRRGLAAVVTLFMGFYTHAHGSGGWDYHNAGAGAFYCLAFAMVTVPAATARRRARPYYVLAGVFATLAVHANITMVNLLPVLGFIHYRTLQARGAAPRWREPASLMAWAAVGAVAVTAVLSLINVLFGREPFFFALLVSIAAQYVAQPSHQSSWWHPWSELWVLKANHLSFPFAVALAGAIVVIRSRRRQLPPEEHLAHGLILQFLFTAVVWVFWQSQGQTALDWNYFAYPLIPSCFIALAGLVRLWRPDAFEARPVLVVTSTIVALTASLSGVLEPSAAAVETYVAPISAVFGALLFLAALGAFFANRAAAGFVGLLVLFALGNRAVAYNSSDYSYRDPCKLQQTIYTTIVEEAQAFGRLDPTYSRTATWYDEGERFEPVPGCPVSMAALGGSITAMVFVPYVTRPWPMPSADKVPDQALLDLANRKGVLAIMSGKAENVATFTDRLTRLHVVVREMPRPAVSSGHVRFPLSLFELSVPAPTDVAFTIAVQRLASRDLEVRAEQNYYGTLRKGYLRRETTGLWWTPTDSRDHVAYAMTPIPPAPEDRWLRVRVRGSQAAADPCRLSIQRETLGVLKTMSCAPVSGTTEDTYLKLPVDAKALRIMIQSTQLQRVLLPSEVEVTLGTTRAESP